MDTVIFPIILKVGAVFINLFVDLFTYLFIFNPSPSEGDPAGEFSLIYIWFLEARWLSG